MKERMMERLQSAFKTVNANFKLVESCKVAVAYCARQKGHSFDSSEAQNTSL